MQTDTHSQTVDTVRGLLWKNRRKPPHKGIGTPQKKQQSQLTWTLRALRDWTINHRAYTGWAGTNTHPRPRHPHHLWPLILRSERCFLDVFFGTKLHIFSFWLVVVFSNSFYCKEKFPWWGVRTTLLCGLKDRYLECNQGLCCFSKVAVSGSSRSMTSLALKSWLGFQYQQVLNRFKNKLFTTIAPLKLSCHAGHCGSQAS